MTAARFTGEVVILGAGIIGCAAAKVLLLQGFKVTLVAHLLPGDDDVFYASNWAGAAWYAGRVIDDPAQRYLLAVSHRHLRWLAEEKEYDEAGVCKVTMREHYEKKPDPRNADKDQWYRNIVEDYRVLPSTEYPSTFEHAVTYTNLVIDPPLHIRWLRKSIEALGGRFIRQKITSLSQLYTMFPTAMAYINASGLGSGILKDFKVDGIEDATVYADKGQNMLIKHENKERWTQWNRNGEEYTYVIPRPRSGVLVVGGIHMGDSDLSNKVDEAQALDEIRRGNILAPSVIPPPPTTGAIAGHAVGIRPARKDGFRVDREVAKCERRDIPLLHAYGFGGTGYAYAYGVAERLAAWVKESEMKQSVWFAEADESRTAKDQNTLAKL